MKESEINVMLDRLFSALQNHELTWITDSANSQITQGKLIDVSATTYKEVSRDSSDASPNISMFPDQEMEVRYTTAGKAKFPKITEYSQRERLEILLDSIEKSLVHPPQMEQHILNFFSNTIEEFEGITFIDDELDEPTMYLNAQQTQRSIPAIDELQVVINEIRNEIRNNVSS